jgi:hypothetical protein
MAQSMTANQWNHHYPVGTPVTAYPGVHPEYAAEIGLTDVPTLETHTRSHAWNLGHGEPVVMVDGYAGGISLGHVFVRVQVEATSTATVRPEP